MCLTSCLVPLVVPTVPCPLSPLKINPKGVYPMELTVKVELHIPECRPKSFDRSCWCARLFRAAWADDCVADLKPEIFCFRAGSVEPTRMERETFQCGGTWTGLTGGSGFGYSMIWMGTRGTRGTVTVEVALLREAVPQQHPWEAAATTWPKPSAQQGTAGLLWSVDTTSWLRVNTTSSLLETVSEIVKLAWRERLGNRGKAWSEACGLSCCSCLAKACAGGARQALHSDCLSSSGIVTGAAIHVQMTSASLSAALNYCSANDFEHIPSSAMFHNQVFLFFHTRCRQGIVMSPVYPPF